MSSGWLMPSPIAKKVKAMFWLCSRVYFQLTVALLLPLTAWITAVSISAVPGLVWFQAGGGDVQRNIAPERKILLYLQKVVRRGMITNRPVLESYRTSSIQMPVLTRDFMSFQDSSKALSELYQLGNPLFIYALECLFKILLGSASFKKPASLYERLSCQHTYCTFRSQVDFDRNLKRVLLFPAQWKSLIHGGFDGILSKLVILCNCFELYIGFF